VLANGKPISGGARAPVRPANDEGKLEAPAQIAAKVAARVTRKPKAHGPIARKKAAKR
jgi:hypothetical protein